MKLAKTVAHLDSDIMCMLLEPRVGHRRLPQSLGGRVECRREPHSLPACSQPDPLVPPEEVPSPGFQSVRGSAMTSVLRGHLDHSSRVGAIVT